MLERVMSRLAKEVGVMNSVFVPKISYIRSERICQLRIHLDDYV